MVDNFILVVLSGIIIHQWRSALGVGNFLSARLVDEIRQYLIRFNDYQYILMRSKEYVIQDKIDYERQLLEKNYYKRLTVHYSIAVFSLLILISRLITEYFYINLNFIDQYYDILVITFLFTVPVISCLVVLFEITKMKNMSAIKVARENLEIEIKDIKTKEDELSIKN